MAHTDRTFAFHGMQLRDKLLLKSMIERAARGSGREWRLTLAVVGDCVFYQGERPRALREGTLPVHVGEDVHGNALVLHYPPRLQDVASLLGAIDRRLAGETAAVHALGSSWHQLVAQIQQHIAQGRAVALVDGAGRGWSIHPGERQFTASGEGERAPADLVGTPATHWRLVDADPPNGHPRRALEGLLWQLGIVAGSEGVLASIGAGRPMRLRVWPYLLARAPKRFGEFAALLRQGPKSAHEMQLAAAAPASEVAAFYNACTLCGFLAAVEQPTRTAARPVIPEAPSARPAQRFTRFLGAIRHALGMSA